MDVLKKCSAREPSEVSKVGTMRKLSIFIHYRFAFQSGWKERLVVLDGEYIRYYEIKAKEWDGKSVPEKAKLKGCVSVKNGGVSAVSFPVYHVLSAVFLC
jgi:hypothetical protein